MPLLSLVILLSLTGCWDKKELNEVAVVIGAGVDKKDNNYRVTAQVIKPVASQGGTSGGSELPTWSLSADGKTIMDAIRALNKISPRRLYWPHMQVIIFGEEMAREGTASVLNWFERDRDSRSGTYVIVTKGKAEDLLNQKIELGNVAAAAMADFLDTAELRQIDARRTTLRDFMEFLTTEGIDPALDVIDPKDIRGKPETYQLSGLAVMKGDKLVGYIEGQKAMGIDIAYQKFQYGIITVPFNENGDFFSYQVTDLRNNVKTDVTDGTMKISMDIFIEGNLSDNTGSEEMVLQPEKMRQAEKQIQKEVIQSIQQTFKEAAELESDLYGIGREIRRHHPDFWHQVKEEWPSRLKEVQLNIKVEANIRRSGLIFDPTPSKLK
ncbi:Ger(x)C family spore germination protein [Ammoniphilus sp. 3BR4]|uniref:Ger(x)C family spore germination protein n=1 Tax=Ammoniphilus sp. 3BR4 TaxID=3158265 RepID=UPI0034657A97